MRKYLLLISALFCGFAAYAQSALDNDFEDGTLGEWTASIPEGHTGGYSVVTYASQSALKVTNVGENTLGGTNVLMSKTGAKNAVKVNSDNWLTSPEFTVGTDNVFSFRLAANCSYSPTKEGAEKMKMDVVVIEGENQTVVSTIAPVNYFTWKQYSIDLSAYAGKTIKVAFHDYGTAGSGAVADMKFIDNVKLTSEKASDFAIVAASELHGQAEYTAPYTITVGNYGVAKGTFTANYQIGEGEVVSETVTSTIAAGETLDYTFTAAPVFAAATTNTFKAWVSGADDAMTANDAVADATITTSAKKALPFAVCNVLDDEDTDNDDLVETVFATATGSSNAKWAYDAINYNAWIFTQKKADAKYQGVGYLYTTDAYTLPAGTVTLKTTGTATLEGNYYEVYIAKYGAKGMADYATKVGQSAVLNNVVETNTIDETTVELTIPEAGDYIIGIRPFCPSANAQVAIIGLSLEQAATPLTATFNPADGAEIAAFNAGDLITVTFNQPEAVGYAEWKLVDNNPANPDEAILRTGMMRKNSDGSWYGKFYYEQKLLQGHTYTATVYPYETEADMQAEADHNTYSNALATLSATYTGATVGYAYSPVKVVSITPELGSALTKENNTIMVVFSDKVTLTAERNGGMMGDNTAIPATASEDGKTWTLTVPESVLTSTSGSLNLNVYVKDADGKVLQGNMGEDENSYFVWAFTCNEGAPEFTVTPAAGTIEKLEKVRVSYPGGINESYATTEKIQVLKGDEVVYTFTDNDMSYDWIDITWLDYTLSTPITEPGTYTVVFPNIYFSLGEEFNGCMSKKQTVTYTIEGVTNGISNINAQDNNILYNLAGQRVNGNVKGIVIKEGKKYIK